jgi:hypothetical protein
MEIEFNKELNLAQIKSAQEIEDLYEMLSH